MAQNGGDGNNVGGVEVGLLPIIKRLRRDNHTQSRSNCSQFSTALTVLLHGVSEAIVLGFQHYLLTVGIAVLIPSVIVPQMGGGHSEKGTVIQNLLFVSGLSTPFQSLLGTRFPTVIVGSFAYLILVTSTIQANRYNSYSDP